MGGISDLKFHILIERIDDRHHTVDPWISFTFDPVRLVITILGIWIGASLWAQEEDATIPLWAIDMYMGGGGEKTVAVGLGQGSSGTFDLCGWFHLGADVDRHISGRWSGRFAFGYELGGWEPSGAGDPFAAPTNTGDRWVIDVGPVRELYRGARSQFGLFVGPRIWLGMDVPVILRLDGTPNTNDLRTLVLHYRPSVGPVIRAGWRWRVKAGSPHCISISTGATYFHCTYDRIDLPNDIASVPASLLPLQGEHHAWSYLFTLGYGGMH